MADRPRRREIVTDRASWDEQGPGVSAENTTKPITVLEMFRSMGAGLVGFWSGVCLVLFCFRPFKNIYSHLKAPSRIF